MAIFSFFHRLYCKKCKTTASSSRAERREERRKRLYRLKLEQGQDQDKWQPLWMQSPVDSSISSQTFSEIYTETDEEGDGNNGGDGDGENNKNTSSVPTSDRDRLHKPSSASSLAPYKPAFPAFLPSTTPTSTAPSSPFLGSDSGAFGIITTTALTTTTTTTAVSSDTRSRQFTASSSTLSTSSSRSSLTRVPTVRNLRRMNNASHLPSRSSKSPCSPPPQLTLSWEHAPRSPLLHEPLFYQSPIMVPTSFATVQRLPRRPIEQRYPLLLTDFEDEEENEGGAESENEQESETGKSSPSSSLSSSPAVPASPMTPTPSPAATPDLDRPLPPLPVEERPVSPRPASPAPSVTTSGPRYVPSYKSSPRPRPAPRRPASQQTLPFLRSSTTFDDILSSKGSASPSPSSSSSSSASVSATASLHAATTFDQILTSSLRPMKLLIPRKPVPAISIPSPVIVPAPPTLVETKHSSSLIRPYNKDRSTRHGQQILSLSLLSSASSRHSTAPGANYPQIRRIPYNSRQGYSMLQTLRRLLIIPADWSASQTLLFILQHPTVRRLALPRQRELALGLSYSAQIGWYGIMQAIDGSMQYHAARKRSVKNLRLPSTPVLSASSASASGAGSRATPHCVPFTAAERDLVACWLNSGEPLFTRQTALSTVLLRKSGRQARLNSYRALPASARKAKAADATIETETETKSAPRYDISHNPRCRYHQLWTGAGKSLLSVTMLAEHDM